jgi:hypothetical protein
MKNTKIIFVAGIFTYLILIPLFFHPDIKTIFYLSSFLSDGVFNIYQFIGANPDKAMLGPFVYPPLSYILFGILFIPIKLLAANGFVDWLGMGNTAVSVDHIFRFLFLIKLPLVLTHAISGFVLIKIFGNGDYFPSLRISNKKQELILLLWFFNPISIYVITMMGQFDGIPALFTLLALYYAKRKPYLSSLLLGLGGAIKTYPLLFIPFLIITSDFRWVKKIKLTVVGVISYLIFVVPFLKTQEFYQNTLISGLSQRLLLADITIGFNERINIVPFLIILLFLYCLIHDPGRSKELFKYFLAIPILILGFSHFHPQWIIWALPFIILAISCYKKLAVSGVLLAIGWIGTVLSFDDKFLTWGLLSPLDSGVFFLPSIPTLISKYMDPLLIQNLSHTVFTASAIFFIWYVFNKSHV